MRYPVIFGKSPSFGAIQEDRTRRSFESMRFPDFQIPRWRLLMQSRTTATLRTAATICLNVGAKVGETGDEFLLVAPGLATMIR